MPDLKATATELSRPDCRYTYEELKEVCVWLARQALSKERGIKNLRSENKKLKERIAKLLRGAGNE